MPLTLIARILAATAALSGTTRGEAAASTGLGRSSFGGAGVAVAELVLEGAGVGARGGSAGRSGGRAVAWLRPNDVPVLSRQRGNGARDHGDHETDRSNGGNNHHRNLLGTQGLRPPPSR